MPKEKKIKKKMRKKGEGNLGENKKLIKLKRDAYF